MRFAWLRTTQQLEARPPSSADHRAILVAYNAIWWVPVLLVVAGIISYTAGLLWFLAITAARATVNLYRNNVMAPERAQYLPLRLP